MSRGLNLRSLSHNSAKAVVSTEPPTMNPNEQFQKGLRMIVLVSLIVLLRGISLFHDFSHSASHPYIPIQ